MAEDFEKHLQELDKITEGIIGKIGDAVKGFAKGISGEEHTEEDSDKESSTKMRKKLRSYLDKGASKDMVGAVNKVSKKGQPFYIGNNRINKISDELLPLLFKYDADGNYNLIYDFEKDKYKIRWLLDGSYEANSLSLSKSTTGGPIRGRHIAFSGIWKSGNFKGLMTISAKIIGGYIVDGIYASKGENFQIPPYNFISEKYVVIGNKILGLPIAEKNREYKSLSIYQVKSGDKIKILDNNDIEHLLNVDKSLNRESTDIIINGTNIIWDNYNTTREKFLKSVITIGENFTIPGVIDINDGVQSVEVKASQYKSKDTDRGSTSSDNYNTIKFPNPVEGWGSTVPDGYKLDVSELEEDETMRKVERFISDAESGKFEKYLNFFKKLISQGRIDGYGKHPSLTYLFKQKGDKFKEEDRKRDATLKYFSDFSENVIDNFQSDRVQKYYENKMSEYLGLSKPKSKSKKSKSSRKDFIGRVGGALDESYNSIKEIVKSNLN